MRQASDIACRLKIFLWPGPCGGVAHLHHLQQLTATRRPYSCSAVPPDTPPSPAAPIDAAVRDTLFDMLGGSCSTRKPRTTVAGGPLDDAITAGHRGGASSPQPRRRVGQRLDCSPAPTTRDGCSCATTATTAAAATTAEATNATAANAAVPAPPTGLPQQQHAPMRLVPDLIFLQARATCMHWMNVAPCAPGCTCRCSCGATSAENAGRGGGGLARGNPLPPSNRGNNIAQGNSGTSGPGQRPQPRRPRPG